MPTMYNRIPMPNKTVSLPDDVLALLDQQDNASAYIADSVRWRVERARQARLRVSMAGVTRPAFMLLMDLTNGLLLLDEMTYADQLAFEMEEADDGLFMKWDVDPAAWERLTEQVRASEALARALWVCKAEFWAAGDRTEWLETGSLKLD